MVRSVAREIAPLLLLTSCSFLAFGIFMASGTAAAQGTLAVTTDKAAYAEGEMISVTVRVDNTSGDYMHLPASTSCQAEFRLETAGETILDLRGQPCTADAITVDFPPGSWREWTWMLDTVALGIPETSGEHQVIGFFPGTEMADTTTIAAEAFIGGQVSVKVLSGVTEADLTPVLDSLNVEVLESRERSDGRTETWQIRGTSISKAVATYAGDPRFGFFKRQFIHLSFVSVETENTPLAPRPGAGEHAALHVYPNPCRARCMVVVEGGGAGPHRLDGVDVDVYDALGRRVHTLTLSGGEAVFSALRLGTHGGFSPGFAPGMYFFAVRDSGLQAGPRARSGRPLVGPVILGQ